MSKQRIAKNKASSEKLELAQKIAANAPKGSKTYATVENALVYFLRWLTGIFNRIFMSGFWSKAFALFMAIFLYFGVASTDRSFGTMQSATLNNVKVTTVYNSEIYEISGIPETVNVILQGDMSDITLQRSATNYSVVADLSGLTEGSYTVKLTPTNFNSQLTVNVLDYPTANVTIKKKVTTKFNISYEFINKNLMDSTYTLNEPTFESTEVLIRASQDTIDSIAFVKALIDVSGVNSQFTRDAKIYAYDNTGHIIDCDIIPNTVSVTCGVDTLNKTVPIVVRPIGNIMEGYAIDSIALDYSTVTVYAPSTVLDLIDAIYIDVDISSITKNTVLSTALEKPSGVNSMSVTKVNMEIGLATATTKTIKDVKVSWANYDSTYKFKVMNSEDALMDVIVTGTQNNLDKLTANDITILIDLSGTKPGQQQVPLLVSGVNTLVDYKLADGREYVDVEITE